MLTFPIESNKFHFFFISQLNSWPILQASAPRALSERNFVIVKSSKTILKKIMEFYLKAESCLIMGEISILKVIP